VTARLEKFKQQLAEALDRRKDFATARHESQVEVDAAQIEVIKSAVDRSRDSAKYIQIASSAIATLYTGIAALDFSLDKNAPLPVRGVIPIVFLGLAIVFSTVYIAWLGPGVTVPPFPTELDVTAIRLARVEWLNQWVSAAVLRRAWALHAATLCLAAGLVFLPAAFVPINTSAAAAGAPVISRPKTNSLPAWPAIPSTTDRFAVIRYKAQVAEIAARRAAALNETTAATHSETKLHEAWIWWSAVGAFVAIAAFALFDARRRRITAAFDSAITTVAAVVFDRD
jgi:hypothetical protein